MAKAKLLLVFLVCTLVIGGTVVYSEPNITVRLNYQPVDIPIKIEDGRSYVPLRALSELLGLNVIYGTDWNGQPQIDLHTLPDTFVSYDQHRWTAHSMPLAHGPQDMAGVGAGAAVSKYLAEEQLASLKQDGPVLVRFDLLEYCSRFGWPPSDIRAMGSEGFVYAVRLFYVQRSDNASGLYSIEHSIGENADGWTTGRPTVQSSWYEEILIDVKPVGEPVYVKTENGEKATWGNNDWVVDPASRRTIAKQELTEQPYVVHGLSKR